MKRLALKNYIYFSTIYCTYSMKHTHIMQVIWKVKLLTL